MQDRKELEYLQPITLREAMAVDDDVFHRLVNADLRSMCHPTVSAALRSPGLLDRWTFHLNDIKRRIEGQLARHKTSIQSMLGDQSSIDSFVKEKANWKMGAISMRSGAEGRLVEARYLARGSRNELLELIRQHKEKVLAYPDDSEDADLQLWKALEFGRK